MSHIFDIIFGLYILVFKLIFFGKLFLLIQYENLKRNEKKNFGRVCLQSSLLSSLDLKFTN